jgi:hypothetical protein
MRQAHTPDPDPQPVVHVMQKPVFIDQPDGTIRAYYPAEDWYVIGSDREDAIAKLHDETDRRMADPEYVKQHFTLAQQHLNGEVTPGFEVNTISHAAYRQRTTELGEQLREHNS